MTVTESRAEAPPMSPARVVAVTLACALFLALISVALLVTMPADAGGSEARGARLRAEADVQSLFVNGRFLSGARPFDRFEEIVDFELAAAKR